MEKEIPYGCCHCGCGQKTNLAPYTHSRRGMVKGEPHRYIRGHQHHPMRSSAEKFWAKVNIGTKEQCWEWQGATLKKMPYGEIMYQTKMWTTHRLAWFLLNGDIPQELFVLHKCDNPRCCNPSHLFLGTQQDNMTDMKNKGRNRFCSGEQHYNAKLSVEKVASIRELHKNGSASREELSQMFGVSTKYLKKVISNKVWA